MIAAVDWCIQNRILDTYFKVHKSEVIGMILTEYNEKQTMENIRKESYAEGRKDEHFEMMAIVEKERAKAEEERAKAEEERAKAEVERTKAEEERARAEEERARAEAKISELEAEIARLKNK